MGDALHRGRGLARRVAAGFRRLFPCQTRRRRVAIDAARERELVEAAQYRARIEAMSYVEQIGSILGRAQIIEEVMRMLIVRASDELEHPRQVTGTFGQLLRRFKALYPNEAALAELLDAARDARNNAAHSDLLVALFIKELLLNQDPDDVDRFQRRAMRKTIEGMDWALHEILRFLDAHPVEFEEWANWDDSDEE
ncbi:MAG: hypothetical protein HZA58_03080 [Acidimicrobiia bacterium]|nr:hypothetical protein [Acidimicrobiia bacterium]